MSRAGRVQRKHAPTFALSMEPRQTLNINSTAGDTRSLRQRELDSLSGGPSPTAPTKKSPTPDAGHSSPLAIGKKQQPPPAFNAGDDDIVVHGFGSAAISSHSTTISFGTRSGGDGLTTGPPSTAGLSSPAPSTPMSCCGGKPTTTEKHERAIPISRPSTVCQGNSNDTKTGSSAPTSLSGGLSSHNAGSRSTNSNYCSPPVTAPPTQSASHSAFGIENHWTVYDGASKIDEHLYLGSQTDATDSAQLEELGIKRVLNLAGGECPTPETVVKSMIKVKQVPLRDHSDENVAAHFDECVAFIREAVVAEEPILVHCRMGVSRAATITIAYLMLHGLKRIASSSSSSSNSSAHCMGSPTSGSSPPFTKEITMSMNTTMPYPTPKHSKHSPTSSIMTYTEAFDHVKKCRPQISPNLGFVLSLHAIDRNRGLKTPDEIMFEVTQKAAKGGCFGWRASGWDAPPSDSSSTSGSGFEWGGDLGAFGGGHAVDADHGRGAMRSVVGPASPHQE